MIVSSRRQSFWLKENCTRPQTIRIDTESWKKLLLEKRVKVERSKALKLERTSGERMRENRILERQPRSREGKPEWSDADVASHTRRNWAVYSPEKMTTKSENVKCSRKLHLTQSSTVEVVIIVCEWKIRSADEAKGPLNATASKWDLRIQRWLNRGETTKGKEAESFRVWQKYRFAKFPFQPLHWLGKRKKPHWTLESKEEPSRTRVSSAVLGHTREATKPDRQTLRSKRFPKRKTPHERREFKYAGKKFRRGCHSLKEKFGFYGGGS